MPSVKLPSSGFGKREPEACLCACISARSSRVFLGFFLGDCGTDTSGFGTSVSFPLPASSAVCQAKVLVLF